MPQLDTRLREIRRVLNAWTPQSGFRAQSLNFTPADIVFGARIASTIRNSEEEKNVDEIISKIRREASLDDTFQSWLLAISIGKLRDVVEFSYFRTPPSKSVAS